MLEETESFTDKRERLTAFWKGVFARRAGYGPDINPWNENSFGLGLYWWRGWQAGFRSN